MMSASLVKLISSVTYTKRNCFIQERDSNWLSECWLGNHGDGRVRFQFSLWRLVSVSLNLCLCLVFTSLHWKDLNSFWKKTNVKTSEVFNGWCCTSLLIDNWILKSETFVSYRYVTWALWKPLKQFRLQVKSVSWRFAWFKRGTNCHSMDYML